MKMIDYFLGKATFLAINVALFSIFGIILWKIDVNTFMIVLLGLVWFAPLLLAFLLDYVKKHSYYQNLVHYQSSLDKKYLLPEMLDKPTFLEGEIVHEAIADAYKQMHEHINEYKREQKEYQEYIETWVHEIKTPLASAKLILHNRDLDYGILEELNKTEQYVEQVLYFARSSHVSKDYLISAFSLHEVVNTVVKRNAKDFIYKKIKLDLGTIRQVVYSDKKWIEFIINQIVGNAIKYSKEPSAEIKISSMSFENKVQLQIQDNGIGIGMKDVSRVFDKGFTGENGRVHSKSTGMGLYLCKRLAKKLHLRISLVSEEGVGTMVLLTFPINKALIIEK
ncbi:sensor histidine kinase [Paraliobacillus salinarum]|uniref:sensor histidine kinase n=1 Tax=Paraliobacillus salinarum TaxID=1158996 RepID=UPI0015F5A27D|nr:sensor histidine kinase [Paraliobacillus salinarum]